MRANTTSLRTGRRLVVAAAVVLTMEVSGLFAAEPVVLRWLGDAPPAVAEGVTWGVPWPKGAVQRNTPVRLATADGRRVELQTWPLAYWPDGSIKWSGHAIAATAGLDGPLTLTPGGPAEERGPLTEIKYTEDADAFTIDTGAVRARLPKSGASLVESLFVGERKVAQDGKLLLVREDRSQIGDGILRYEDFTSRVERATLEQSGPVRAVLKIEGRHRAVTGEREWLPFTVRLAFFAGSPSVRIMHSFVYDGDPERDFIKGLGLAFSVPFAEELHNRHVRFAGDGTGMWVQPVRLLPGYRPQAGPQITEGYADHLAGKRVPGLADMEERSRNAAQSVAVYDAMKLTQPGPNSWSIHKRANAMSSWVHVTDGRRSLGLASLGDVSGGIAVGLRDFWQKHPSALEVTGATTDAGQLRVWFWSPEAGAMDLRHYDTVPHGLRINYEDWKPGWATPEGIANTSELTLWAYDANPSNEDLVQMSKAASAPSQIVCTPQYYHAQQAFGFLWGLPDRSTPVLAWVEDQVTGLLEYYRDQVDERSWYGFWDFGDWMHNYDFGRHEWRYDIGGWAWINTELMPDILAWYSFLRTGRADFYRLAEAMTRHTSEVDVHHSGPFAPLGSRHNVVHWGDGAKQPRISHAGIKNFLYYLTADERTGDLMREQIDADLTYAYLVQFNGAHYEGISTGEPRLENPNSRPAPRPEEFAPRPTTRDAADNLSLDWMCYAMNWMAEWERTGDPQWRDHVLADIESILARPAPTRPVSHFSMIFGSPENMAQMEAMFDVPGLWARWADMCEVFGRNASGGTMGAPRALAYAARAKNSTELGVLAWEKLIGNAFADGVPSAAVSRPAFSPDTVNPVHDPIFLGASVGWQLHGPASVQWALSAIATSALARDHLDDWEASKKADK
jgi:hypothetical protein